MSVDAGWTKPVIAIQAIMLEAWSAFAPAARLAILVLRRAALPPLGLPGRGGVWSAQYGLDGDG